jgi:energy-converting hydrogenase Eha subunit F
MDDGINASNVVVLVLAINDEPTPQYSNEYGRFTIYVGTLRGILFTEKFEYDFTNTSHFASVGGAVLEMLYYTYNVIIFCSFTIQSKHGATLTKMLFFIKSDIITQVLWGVVHPT